MARIKKYLLIFAGSLGLGLGVIGMFLPLLPTVPFLLLSSFCYLRSSDRLYQWLMHHKVFGAHLYHYAENRVILKSTRTFSLIFLWGALMVSIFLVDVWFVRVLLVFIGIGVSSHLFSLKAMEKSEFEKIYAVSASSENREAS